MVLSARLEVLATEDPSDDPSNKSILQHLYFIIAVVVALLLVSFRLYLLRRRNRPATDFFSIVPSSSYYSSQAPGDHAFGSSYQHSQPLAPLPSVYRPGRRVNAADTDADGRRFGEPDDPYWDGKDTLPAYNNIDRPPKYDIYEAPPQVNFRSPGTNPGDDSVVADAEALSVVEQPLADITSASDSGRVEPAPSALHGLLEASN